jgi:hypothetical protein
MAMTGKWLKRHDGVLVPARGQGTPALQSSEFDRRMAQFMRAKGVTETFCLTAMCRERRNLYTTTFERCGPGELFKQVRVEAFDLSEPDRTGSSTETQKFDVEDTADWECPCGARGWVRCCCGQISCHTAREKWRCDPGCGRSGLLTPARTVMGSKPNRNALGRKSSSSGLLQPSAVPRLPGK